MLIIMIMMMLMFSNHDFHPSCRLVITINCEHHKMFVQMMTMHLFISISMLIHILVDAASGVLKVEVKIPVDPDSIKLVIFLEFD